MSVSVVYWSGTGNTQTMAEAVAKGIEEAGGQANLMEVGSADAAVIAQESAFALGCLQWEQNSWKKVKWNHLLKLWSRWYPEKQFCCLDPMDGETENG